MLPVKYLSLQKSELEYEVRIRGVTAASSVEELRKQIVKLGKDFPSEHILESPLEARQDLKGCVEVLTKIQISLDSPNLTVPSIMRAENMLNHLHNRIARITCSDERTNRDLEEVVKEHTALNQKLASLKSKKPAGGTPSVSEPVPEQNVISVTCDRGSADLIKIKFNGKTCVRSFIQRVDEYIEARNLPSQKILVFATEIFQDDALHWFRSVKDKVSSWAELASKLREDFDQSDYDYRLISEIRSRTQGERENITIYLSVMNGMFSRLSKPLSEADQLEILLHNIRPCYANTLVSASQISSIDSLRVLCRNYEDIQARLSHFREPPKSTSDTVAPEFAYNRDVNKNLNKIFNSCNNNSNFNKYNNNYSKPNYSYNNQHGQNRNVNQNYVHSVQVNKNQPYCPRCRNNTHHIRQCQAKRDVFCFKCGKKDVKTPDCPVCSKVSKN